MRSRVLFLMAALLMAATVTAEARAVQAARAVAASGQFETEHVAEDWRIKYLGISSRVEETACGSPDQVAPLGDGDSGGQGDGGDHGLI